MSRVARQWPAGAAGPICLPCTSSAGAPVRRPRRRCSPSRNTAPAFMAHATPVIGLHACSSRMAPWMGTGHFLPLLVDILDLVVLRGTK